MKIQDNHISLEDYIFKFVPSGWVEPIGSVCSRFYITEEIYKDMKREYNKYRAYDSYPWYIKSAVISFFSRLKTKQDDFQCKNATKTNGWSVFCNENQEKCKYSFDEQTCPGFVPKYDSEVYNKAYEIMKDYNSVTAGEVKKDYYPMFAFNSLLRLLSRSGLKIVSVEE